MNATMWPTSQELEAVVSIRRDLHANPELGFEEFRTAQLVIETLREIPGVEIIGRVAQTGVVARIDSGRPGPILALRSDMDALPIEEKSGVPWSSRIPGRMHACGHDGHTAALLGTARVLARQRTHFRGQVILVFQPAEEALAGARHIVDDGILQRLGVEAIFGAHNWPGLSKGLVATNSGVMMAASNAFSLRVTGRSCHASQPHRGADPIVAAAQIVSSAANLRSRLVDPCEPAVISIGCFHAGTKGNIVPDEALLNGTMRTIRRQTLDILTDHLQILAEGLAWSVNCSAHLTVSPGYPAVRNIPSEARFLVSVARRLVGEDRTISEFPVVLAGEDFSFYLESLPGAFWFMGVGETAVALHSSAFDFCDDVLSDMIAIQVGLITHRGN